ncbi:MAG TPA: GH116 family glycosyl hydrolase, partial [Thermomicrobiales bacterium]|nr:GH116 family glycosyl hydrolase [Thermomicrobiales bacterium]
EHGFRVYADRDDNGLLICTWPKGGRPTVPVRYCDEVWTGIEYQVAALCIMEGLVDEGMRILVDLRNRYSGERRNPYNEIECGDHYSRAMAGWSVLEAISGVRYDATRREIRLAAAHGRSGSRVPIMTDTGWGMIQQETREARLLVEIHVSYGSIEIRSITVDDLDGDVVSATLGHDEIAVTVSSAGGRLTIALQDETSIDVDQTLALQVSRQA